MKFRPDVTLFAAKNTFPLLEGVLVTEDFEWAMWNGCAEGPERDERSRTLALRAHKLAGFYAADLPAHPAALVVPLLTGDLRDPNPIPLLLSRRGDQLVLGILTDACPEPAT